MTNYEKALELLDKVKSVNEWNIVRDSIKHTISTQELGIIDSSGLITKILGQDK